MKIRTKILVSLIATAIVIIIAFLVFLIIKANRDRLLLISNQQQQNLAINAAMLLHERYMVNLANDYSVWDEMAAFSKTGDTLWSNSNIRNVPIIHNLDGFWVTDINRNFLLTLPRPLINIDEQGFTKQSFFDFLMKSRTCHFFAIHDSNIYEFSAGTIHSSMDIQKRQDPSGFLILCQQMDSSYLKELESLSGCKIGFTKNISLQNSHNNDDSEIISLMPIYTWDHVLLGYLKFSHEHELLRSYFRITSLTSYAYLFLSLLLLALMCTALYFWINKPMTKVAESLSLESSEPIDILLNKKNEFGEVATMIERFFIQKKVLAEIIHEKDVALSSLSEAEAKNRALLDAIPDLLIKINLFGIITDFHIGHQEHLPFPDENQLMGKNLEEILPPSVRPLIGDAIKEINLSRKPQSLVFQIPFFKGSLKFFEATLTLTALGDYLVVMRNITPQKEAEIALHRMLEKEAELNSLKTQFITTVSHEFRTPLSAISSNIQLFELYGEKWSEDKKTEAFQRIQKAIQELITLLNDLSAIAKDQSGKLRINPTNFDLPGFCQELIKDSSGLFKSSVNVQMEYETEIIQVKMDKDLLRHIFINLLSNAIKFSPADEIVVFKINDAGENHLKFTISDKGVGIPPEELESIYEPFHRAHNVAAYPGSGLGLSIVKRCIDLHLGILNIKSKLDQGTIVTVILPAFFLQPETHEKDSDY